MIAVAAAVREELEPLLGRLTVERTTHGPGWHVFEAQCGGHPIVVLQTGVGKAAAIRAAGLLLDRYPVRVLLSVGFAGGLSPAVRVGDLVASTHIHEEGLPAGFDGCDPDAELRRLVVQRARSAEMWIVEMATVTVSRLLCTPRDKRRLGLARCAGAVDMESYWLASAARRAGARFVAVRAISDAVDERLPPLDDLVTEEGVVRRAAAARRLLAQPRMLGTLPRLIANVHRASRAVARFVETVIPALAVEAGQ